MSESNSSQEWVCFPVSHRLLSAPGSQLYSHGESGFRHDPEISRSDPLYFTLLSPNPHPYHPTRPIHRRDCIRAYPTRHNKMSVNDARNYFLELVAVIKKLKTAPLSISLALKVTHSLGLGSPLNLQQNAKGQKT